MIGTLTADAVRTIEHERDVYTAAQTRRDKVLAALTATGKVIDARLRSALANAATVAEIDEVYAPFKPDGKKTKAAAARAAGLGDAADQVSPSRIPHLNRVAWRRPSCGHTRCQPLPQSARSTPVLQCTALHSGVIVRRLTHVDYTPACAPPTHTPTHSHAPRHKHSHTAHLSPNLDACNVGLVGEVVCSERLATPRVGQGSLRGSAAHLRRRHRPRSRDTAARP
jgi:hypothetical protein